MVLEGSHLHGIGKKKNRPLPTCGNYSEDNTDGVGERKAGSRAQGKQRRRKESEV